MISDDSGDTELYFFVDPLTKIIYYDVLNSMYNGVSDKFNCTNYYQEDNAFGERICLINIGRWDDVIPMPSEYPILSPVGSKFFNYYMKFRETMGKSTNDTSGARGPEIIETPIEENIENLPFDIDKLSFVGVTNDNLSTQLYFFIDQVTRIIYLDVRSSKYADKNFNLDCTDYNIQDARVCLVNLGVWQWSDPLPITGTWYNTKSIEGYRLTNLITIYADFNEKKKTNFSDVDDLPDLTEEELMMGEGVVEELRGIRDAILQTGRCYQYTGSPIISMAEQSGSAPFQTPQSSMMPSPMAGIPPPPVAGLPPPPPPGSEKKVREMTPTEILRATYANADLTKLSDAQLDELREGESQLFEKLKLLTYKAYVNNLEAIKVFNTQPINKGWAISSTPKVAAAVKAESNKSVGFSADDVAAAARKRAARREAAAAAAAEGSGMYRRRHYRSRRM